MAVSKLDVNYPLMIGPNHLFYYTFLVYVWMIQDKSITQNSEQC